MMSHNWCYYSNGSGFETEWKLSCCACCGAYLLEYENGDGPYFCFDEYAPYINVSAMEIPNCNEVIIQDVLE